MMSSLLSFCSTNVFDNERIFNFTLLEQLTFWDYIFLALLATLSFEILNWITSNVGKWFHIESIPVRGKHLDELNTLDYWYITFSKMNTAPFLYVYCGYAYRALSNQVIWDIHQMNVYNTLVGYILLVLLFDFFYTLFHWFLHVSWIYPYIHKHHHQQMAPSRANIDAVNVHPIEYIIGEYNHIWVVYLCTQYIMPVHIITLFLFLLLGGFLAGMNHTRSNITISIGGITLYDSKVHDVHHRIPQANYGQYTMFWDYIFGTYRPYNPQDRVNPDSQLDPITGKSIVYMKSHKHHIKM